MAENAASQNTEDAHIGQPMRDPLVALGSSSAHLRRIVQTLGAGQFDAPAYPSEWTIADVLSHLGSGAVILRRLFEDTLAGTETPPEFSQAVWDLWEQKPSVARAADALVADQELTTRLGSLTSEERSAFRFVMGPINEDLAGFICLRLNEHVLHTWDIEVTIDPAAILSTDATHVVIDRLELVARFTGKAPEAERRLSVRTTGPRRDFTLALGPQAVSLIPSGPGPVEPDLELPAEAFIRLVYGRLDPQHTPGRCGGEHLETLRRVFPGP